MILTETTVPADELAHRTGWVAKPEGLCKGPMCVPLPADSVGAGGGLDMLAVAERLGMPVLRDTEHGLWAFGPATVAGRALESADAPELTLPDLDGNDFTLASLRGKKVVVFAWASW